MNKPLVSVITPVYNCADYLEKTIFSVLKQTYRNFELILVNDCSPDDSLKICEKLQKNDSRVRVIDLKINSGAAIARNMALDAANGEYIAFLDSDDIWLPNKLEFQIRYMIENHIAFSFTSYQTVGKNRGISKLVDYSHKRTVFAYKDLLYKRITLGCSTVVLHKEAVENLRMPNIRTGQDFAFWLSILRRNVHFVHLIKEPLTEYTVRYDSISANKLKKAKRQWEILVSVEGLAPIKAVAPFISYAYHATLGRK